MRQDDLAKEPARVTLTGEGILELLGLIPYAAIIVDEEGQIVLFNRLATQLFGYRLHEIVGRSIEILMPHHHQAGHAQHRSSYMASPTSRSMENRLDLVALHHDGFEFPVDIALSPLILEEGPRILAVVRDISRRKQEEEQLSRSLEQMRVLSSRLLSLREAERSRISRLIHDEIGQMLSGIKMDLAWLQRRLDQGQETLLDKTEEMAELIDATVQIVRRMSTELRPGILDDLGLEAAVEWQLEEFQRRTDIRCTFISNMQHGSPDAAATTAAFRILQEALTNVVRHAEAGQVEVLLTSDEHDLMLVVRDDGRGITTGEINDPRSIGLLGMRERARERGGRLELEGVAGKGTTVTLQLPLTAGEQEY